VSALSALTGSRRFRNTPRSVSPPIWSSTWCVTNWSPTNWRALGPSPRRPVRQPVSPWPGTVSTWPGSSWTDCSRSLDW